MKYGHILTVALSTLAGITVYGIAYGANSINYVKDKQYEYVAELKQETTTVAKEDLEPTDIEEIATDDTSVSSLKVNDAPTRSGGTTIHTVPFYSQFTDISAPEWRKIGCGIASLAMLIDYYKPGAVTVDGLLDEGIAAGAYVSSAGWSHAGLIGLAKAYGLSGEAVYMTDSTMDTAFTKLERAVEEGPVMVSVHYTFQPTNPIPHLVIVTGVAEGMVHYNDPAEKSGGGTVSIKQFQSAWKKRYIEIRS